MGKNHIIRMAAPKTWHIRRDLDKFVTKPARGPHRLSASMPLGVVLTEIMGYADTKREAKKILNSGEVKVDGTVRRDIRFPVGIFDTVEFPSINEQFRVILDGSGRIGIVRIKKDESLIKPCKITGKRMVKGKIQLNLYDGRNIFVENNSYKVGGTLMLSVPEHKITMHLKLDKKSAIFLTGGKHTGEIGVVEDIVENRIVYKDRKGDLIQTSKRYAFVIGDGKPLITIVSNEPDEKYKN